MPTDWLASRSGAGMTALGLAGVAIGALVIFIEPVAHWLAGAVGIDVGSTYDQDTRDFIDREQTALWLFLLCAQVGLWAVLLVPIARALENLRPWWRARSAAVYVGVVLASTAVISILTAKLVAYPRGLPGHTTKVDVITAFAIAVAALAAAGVGFVTTGVDELEGDLASQPDVGPAIWERRAASCVGLRAALDSLLAITAAIIGAGVLSTGVLREATISWQQALDPATSPEAIFPEEQVLAYGVGFSFVLALVYLPVYVRLQAVGTWLRDAWAPMIWPPGEGWSQRADERSMLDRELKLDRSATTSFRIAAGVLAPLALSAISRALGS
jgi:hypothetical protein